MINATCSYNRHYCCQYKLYRVGVNEMKKLNINKKLKYLNKDLFVVFQLIEMQRFSHTIYNC